MQLVDEVQQEVSVQVTNTTLHESTPAEENTNVCFQRGGLRACYKEKVECIGTCQTHARQNYKNQQILGSLK